MESKEQMRARHTKSPDRADMLTLLFCPGEEVSDKAPEVWQWR